MLTWLSRCNGQFVPPTFHVRCLPLSCVPWGLSRVTNSYLSSSLQWPCGVNLSMCQCWLPVRVPEPKAGRRTKSCYLCPDDDGKRCGDLDKHGSLSIVTTPTGMRRAGSQLGRLNRNAVAVTLTASFSYKTAALDEFPASLPSLPSLLLRPHSYEL